MRDLLVVAYNFPPCSVSGTHRTLAFVKYLEQAGWRSTVLCAQNPAHPERDESLMAQIPVRTRITRTVDLNLLAWPEWLWGRVRRAGKDGSDPNPAVPESDGWNPLRSFKHSLARRLRPFNRCPGWYRATVRTGRRLLQLHPVDALYSSGPPWTTHLAACQLAREFQIPWVADFRDPWVANPFAPPDARLAQRDKVDEASVVSQADTVVCVLDTMRRDLLARYPRRSPADLVTIMNGFDPAYFVALDSNTGTPARSAGAPLTILHAGQVYGPRRVEPLLHGLKEWIRAEPAMATSVRLHLIGGSGPHVASLRSRVSASGTAEWVEVEPEIPHAEALRRLADAAVLLLIGFSGPGEQYQMSGKIFEYLALRRPILALAPPSSPVGNVLRETGARHWIVSPDDAAGLLRVLREIGEEWRQGNLSGPQAVSSLAAYNRREQARQLATVLERAVASKGDRPPRPAPIHSIGQR